MSGRKSEGAKTAGVTEVKALYELGEDCLWITFADGYLWWAFAHPEVQWVWNGSYDDPARKRATLHGWRNTETLADLIFARSGWQRSTRVGENVPDTDLVMEQPTTGEIAFVQVKSKAGQATVDDYLGRFRRSGYDRFFFVCHTAQEKLTLPDERGLHLFEGEQLADAAVKNGLYDWLIERSG